MRENPNNKQSSRPLPTAANYVFVIEIKFVRGCFVHNIVPTKSSYLFCAVFFLLKGAKFVQYTLFHNLCI